MDEPLRKRRKTSSPAQQDFSPLRKPPRRPSSASPIKASLARNDYNLLPARTPPRDDIRSRGEQVRRRALEEPGAPEKAIGEGAEEGTELRSSPPQRGLAEQHHSRQDVLFPSPIKRPPRLKGALRRSPLAPAPAPAVQRNQLTRPTEDALDEDGPKEKTRKPPLDPEIDKRRQEKARLQREIKELEAQVSRCTSEIAVEQQRDANDALLPAQRADLIKFITNISGADEQDERPIPISSLLCSFLPFSSLTILPHKRKQPERPIASHRPIDLPDPLPYLEMFTNFRFSTQLGLPRGKALSSSKHVHQKHTIDISGPQKLLTAQLAVNIDCLSNEVIDMHILRLPTWTERELGIFMRSKAKEKNLGMVCWAIDSFWDVTAKRAAYWHKCEAAFVHLLTGRTITATENARPANAKSAVLSRKDLGRHLGRDTLILQDKRVLLKISWRIVFDWTGEAESNIGVECAVPAVWKEADASDTFRKIPETFGSLLRAKGAFEATRILVALLFSQ
ncbi:uncharacterized protein M421DRAFT_416460 [Didymella exigua CBS 183.55]|uniref:Uncharacterized protein n=1 Tax=Didymella exigua CBS 183.55 TaxID=1150837 RepID=A0A6A5RZV1_9PLEO|nr:uncharacterized protein M421DRAFT_416460 [Didymella exigua CBS 183.55]KAF1932860.1 hypothetical protein M421DRAFT_416460 [Didymella exigua CBS 183.55]